MKTLKILSVLLLYPEESWIRECPQMIKCLEKEQLLKKEDVEQIKSFCRHLQETELLILQETYVTLFDRTPSLSLHLFEHVHGDSRERGQALVDLQSIYLEQGLEMDVSETPDYLPLFLEYLSTLSFEESREQLKMVATIFSILKSRLAKRESTYRSLFQALEALAAQKVNKNLIKKALEKDAGLELTLPQLDKIWEEQFAFSQGTDKPFDKSCRSPSIKEELR